PVKPATEIAQCVWILAHHGRQEIGVGDVCAIVLAVLRRQSRDIVAQSVHRAIDGTLVVHEVFNWWTPVFWLEFNELLPFW
ncbi:hypothetical protein, partial [Mesorhizobium sp. M2E.F.Ca.ET.209.01.1.1]|uniref:hypothetical protein n=1 Tax=Mesorhizobium sp. M2E.F.Ca.ET.209.01.1.1 TaxID=2500526 RepID=UPI0016747533